MVTGTSTKSLQFLPGYLSDCSDTGSDAMITSKIVLLSSILVFCHGFVIVPYHTYPLSPVAFLYPTHPLYHTAPIPQSRISIKPAVEPSVSTLSPGLKFSPTRASPNKNVTDEEELPLASTRLAVRNLDLCYFLANDIFTSHVPCNPNWGDGTLDGVKAYINELTFEANRMVGENNLRFSWKGPYERHDPDARSPTNPTQDVLSVAQYGCDAVVFLVFNKFDSDCKTQTYGHEFGGVSYGGMCEQADGLGYTVVVDQGFLKDAWTGPQILAHHLLLMLTSDLKDQSKTCPNIESLLHPKLYPGEQRVDQCVVDKLNRSGVSLRQCMQN